jgi:hypothetical protein
MNPKQIPAKKMMAIVWGRLFILFDLLIVFVPLALHPRKKD